MLKYETDLQVADAEKLRKEADEVFGILKIDAAKGNFTSAIVSANQKPSGLIFKPSKGYNFVYEKRATVSGTVLTMTSARSKSEIACLQ